MMEAAPQPCVSACRPPMTNDVVERGRARSGM